MTAWLHEFTTEDLEHLLIVMRSYRETGDYHGDRDAWWTRHELLTKEVEEAVRISKDCLPGQMPLPL